MNGEQVPKSGALPCYANMLAVGHNAFEFVLDFAQSYEPDPRETRSVRIVTAPAYAKAMLETLRTAVERYEATYGLIRSGQDDA